ncbi:Trimethylguanosine synthase [Nakaseomyces bracarensis]|uniref:Trimethylguanosine synthase n=1 Tax=Nakaseomyces bracarensis TaxID=273131 RepID=A0ABR4NTZ2_9SACH
MGQHRRWLIHGSDLTSKSVRKAKKKYEKYDKTRHQFRKLRKFLKENKFLVNNEKPAAGDKQHVKYWRKRFKLFSRIREKPIYMTSELWFSVTPERIAKFLATFVSACLPGATSVLDVFSGGGGNSIHFANHFQKVYCVDSNLEHLYCTARNAQSYGVCDRIWLYKHKWGRKAARHFKKLKVDCIFGSPPWGGPEYINTETYDLENSLIPYGIHRLLSSFKSVSDNIILFLPKNSDLDQLNRATIDVMGANSKCKVIYMKEDGYPKGIMCMWGEAFTSYEEEGTAEQLNSDADEDIAETTEKENIDINYDIDG